jgi:hypothetical protein
VRGAQKFLVFGHLLQQVFECALHRSLGRLGFGLHGHLSGRQPQVQRNAGSFAGGDLLHHAFEMDQFRAKDLQAFPQFFDLMLDVFFYGGSFVKPVTDVDVH